ncbi:MAG: LuxR C-terminal-related transcriptional regulator [Coriobacteriia bacterium]
MEEPKDTATHSRDLGHVAETAAWIVGFGSYWAWDYVKILSQVLQPSFASGAYKAHMLLSLSTATAVLMFAAVFAPRFTHLGLRRHALLVGAVLAATGTLLSAVSDRALGLSISYVIGAVFAGAGLAILTLSWGEAFGSLSPREQGIRILGSFAFCAVEYFVLTVMLQRTAAIAVMIALPVISAAVLLLRFPALRAPEQALSFSVRGSGLLSRWKLWAGMGVYAVAVALVKGLTPAQSAVTFNIMNTVTVVAVGVITLLLTRFVAPRGLHLGALYRLLLPVMIAGFFFLVIPFSYNWLVANVLILGGFFLIDVLAWSLLAEVAYRTHTASLVVFGWGKSIISGSCLFGLSLGLGIQSLTGLSSVAITATALAAAFVLVITASFVLSAGDIRRVRLWESESVVRRREPRESSGGAVSASYADPDEPLRIRCASIAEARGLSPRETEVLFLLAKGRDSAHIQKVLHISRGTTNTHTGHIYRKLDVHSQQELLDFVDGWSLTR